MTKEAATMKPRNKPIHINLTGNQRGWLYFALTAGVIILGCAAGFLLQSSEWRFTTELGIVLAADGIAYLLFGKRLWVRRWAERDNQKVLEWRNENKLVIVLSNGLSLIGDILLSLIYLEHYGDAEVIRIFEGMSFFNGRFFLDLINLWQKVPVLSLGLPAFVGCCIALAFTVKFAAKYL